MTVLPIVVFNVCLETCPVSWKISEINYAISISVKDLPQTPVLRMIKKVSPALYIGLLVKSLICASHVGGEAASKPKTFNVFL